MTGPNIINLEAPSDFKAIEEILREAGFDAGGPSPWGHSFYHRAGKCLLDGVLLRRHGFEPSTKKAINCGLIYHECMALRTLVLTGRKPAQSFTDPARAVCDWADDHPSPWAVKIKAWATEVIDWCIAYDAHWQQPPPELRQAPTRAVLQKYDFPIQTVGPIEFMLEVAEPFPYSMRADKLTYMVDDQSNWSVLYPDLKSSSGAERLIRTYLQESQSAGAFHLWDLLRGKVVNGVQLPDLPMDYFALDILEKKKNPDCRRAFFSNRPERQALFVKAGMKTWERLSEALELAKDVPDHDVHRVIPMEGWINGNCFWGPREECPRSDYCSRLVDNPPAPVVQVFPTWDLAPMQGVQYGAIEVEAPTAEPQVDFQVQVTPEERECESIVDEFRRTVAHCYSGAAQDLLLNAASDMLGVGFDYKALLASIFQGWVKWGFHHSAQIPPEGLSSSSDLLKWFFSALRQCHPQEPTPN